MTPSATPPTQPVSLSGAQHEIAAGDYRATIVEVGAGLRELWYGVRPLTSSYDADEVPPGADGQILIPWPNRVDHGRYVFAGDSYQLDITEPTRDNALHGLVRWTNWRTALHEPDRVRLTYQLHGGPGYPFVLDLEVEYALDATRGLTVRISATNVGTRPAPYGNGAHPYLTAGTPTIDDCVATIPAARWLPTDHRYIPSTSTEHVDGTPYDLRTGRRLAGLRLDSAFTELDRDGQGRAWASLATADDGDQVMLWADETYPWLQTYCGDELPEDRRRTAFAVEPMSCPPNAFVTGEDLVVVAPGETVTGTWGITAG
ncbi:MAG: aldose epimerase [Streptosporangiales bacterium]|nr:aldose epimerase [Streptosporangiales bacterium]